jgi:hypothetical protein
MTRAHLVDKRLNQSRCRQIKPVELLDLLMLGYVIAGKAPDPRELLSMIEILCLPTANGHLMLLIHFGHQYVLTPPLTILALVVRIPTGAVSPYGIRRLV